MIPRDCSFTEKSGREGRIRVVIKGRSARRGVYRSRALNVMEIVVNTPAAGLAHLQTFNSVSLNFKSYRPNPEGTRNVHRLSRFFFPMCPEGSNEPVQRIKPSNERGRRYTVESKIEEEKITKRG